MTTTSIPSATERSKFHDFALAAWLAPLLAVALNIGFLAAKVPWDSRWRILPSALILIGLVSSVIALIGIRRHGTQSGLLAAAMTGLILTCAVVVLSAVAWRNSRPPVTWNVASTQAVMDDYVSFPGWSGAGEALGAWISIVSIHDDSQAAKQFRRVVEGNAVLCSLAVDNRRGTNTILVNPSEAQLVLPDNSKVPSLRTEAVYASAKVEDAQRFERFTGVIKVPPGKEALDLSVFFPRGTDLSNVVGMAIAISAGTNRGKAFIGGQYLTSEQKKLLRDLGPGAYDPTNPAAIKRIDASPPPSAK